MSCSIIHKDIQTVLEETSAVYSMICHRGERPNTDYAGYTCHLALNRFKKLLNDPNLTSDKLESLMRKAARKQATRNMGQDWSSLMARYIEKQANLN